MRSVVKMSKGGKGVRTREKNAKKRETKPRTTMDTKAAAFSPAKSTQQPWPPARYTQSKPVMAVSSLTLWDNAPKASASCMNFLESVVKRSKGGKGVRKL